MSELHPAYEIFAKDVENDDEVGGVEFSPMLWHDCQFYGFVVSDIGVTVRFVGDLEAPQRIWIPTTVLDHLNQLQRVQKASKEPESV